MGLFKHSRWEIHRNFALRLFTAIISGIILLQWFDWITNSASIMSSIEYGQIVPWPFDPRWEVAAADFIYQNFGWIKYTSMTFAVLAIVMTFNTHTYIAAYFLAMLSFILLQVFFFSDYRLTSTIHHILSLLGVVFFMLPNKRRTIKSCIFLVLVLSGIYQLNSGMLNGDQYNFNWVLNLHIPFVILLLFFRIISPFFLFSKVRWLRYAGAFIFAGTLVIDYLIQPAGFLLTTYLLLVFFLYLDVEEKKRADHRYTSYILPEPHPGWPYLVALCYLGLQASYLATPPAWPDPVRYFFTMHSSPRVKSCSTAISTHSKNYSELIKVDFNGTNHSKCDLIEVYQMVKSHCDNQLSGNDSKIQILHNSYYYTGPFQDRKTVVKVNDLNACENIKDSSFKEVTQWIKVQESPSKYF